MSLRASLSLLVLVVPAAAQRTIVVDAANGPGTHFTDLPPAIAAAVTGDTILVRTGAYQLPIATTNQGFSILGLGNPRLMASSFTQVARFRVENLAPGQTFIMKGFSIDTANVMPLVRFANCQGLVHLEDVTATLGPTPIGLHFPDAPAVEFDRCATATLTACALKGAPGLRVVGGSHVAASECTLRGQDATLFGLSFSAAVEAVNVTSSSFTLTGGRATGGNGIQGVPPGPALALVSSSTILAGDSTTTLVPNVASTNGTITVDPAVAIPGGFFGSAQVTVMRLPALTGHGAAPGTPVTATVYSPAGDLVVFLAGGPWPATQVPPFGELWLDPLGIFFVTAAVQGTGEHWNVSMMTSASVTRGLPISLQALSGTGLALVLTTPTVVVLH